MGSAGSVPAFRLTAEEAVATGSWQMGEIETGPPPYFFDEKMMEAGGHFNGKSWKIHGKSMVSGTESLSSSL